jgi:class 3 adenylate cyclase
MIHPAVCPLLVGRDDELSALEDALLDANRGSSRFVVLTGEAGIGKTRLATDLMKRASKLGCTTMWGSCSEADLALPYLPLLEAVGNYLAGADVDDIGGRLGAARYELAQLFPQLATGGAGSPPGDPSQAKMRLFESIVSLLSIAAQRTGLLLVIEDIHWAESSSRELLDYLARRLRVLRIMVLVTYRKDELHRRHPLRPTIQGWRRSGFAEIIELRELNRNDVAEVIAAIFDSAPSEDFRDVMYSRSEGNPFVLEEMLREALDCGEIHRTADGWERRAVEQVRLPETVRDTILMRVGRLEPEDGRVVEAAAVLGRHFDYPMLVATSDVEEGKVQGALEAAIREQLIEDDPGTPGRFRFRHALTQEAIYTDIVLPRRQQMHSRASDVFASAGEEAAFDLAFHLSEAGRHEEAVPACLRGADQAVRRYAYGDAVVLYERALRHVTDQRQRGEIICRLGEALWLDGRSSRAERHLDEGIELLNSIRQRNATAHYLITRGRCRWERSRPDLAEEDYGAALEILEPEGASRDLAVVYTRMAGMRLFEVDGTGCVEAAEKAASIAAEAGAEDARAWALGFLAFGRFDQGDADDAFRILEEAYRLAIDRGYPWIASNHSWNEVWTRTNAMAPDIHAALRRLRDSQHGTEVWASWQLLARSYVERAEGDLHRALKDALESSAINERLGIGKILWRSELASSDALVELGRLEESARHLPDISTRAELQDSVYDLRPRVRLHLATGEAEKAAEAVQTIFAETKRVGMYRFVVALAVEAILPTGDVNACREIVSVSRDLPHPHGFAFLDQAEGRIELASGTPARARELLRAASSAFAAHGWQVDELRTRSLLAEALWHSRDKEGAQAELQGVLDRARSLNAELIASEARAQALRLDVVLDEDEMERSGESGASASTTSIGERLVTVMFADVRGYTAMTAQSAPSDMVDRISSLQRWAKREVERQHGLIDKFAGDAVMATFNASGASVDHCRQAVEAALALRDKAALMDLQLGVGIAVGPAVVGRLTPGANVSVLGDTTNLAARLQAEAGPGELLLSDSAYKRVGSWLRERGTRVKSERVRVKGLEEPVLAYRVHP